MQEQENVRMHVVVVTGMSGSGKSVVMDVLEDIGYYCSIFCVESQCCKSSVYVNPLSRAWKAGEKFFVEFFFRICSAIPHKERLATLHAICL